MASKTRKRELTTNSTFLAKEGKPILLRRMQKENADGFLKQGTFSTEIVWGNTSYIFPSVAKKKHTEFKKGMFLFGMVRRDARKFLEAGIEIEIPEKNPSIFYNSNYTSGFEGEITATDLNHAYWRIAMNIGIISEKTYERGLDINSKSTRLATLSTLGAPKKYFIIKDGKVTNDIIIVGGNTEMAELYTLIRYTCFKMMMDLRKILGDDFLAYKTDCIYYKKSTQNVKIVRDFFKKHGLLMKQLI